MTDSRARRLADDLPDEPHWVETRAMLQSDGAWVQGGPSAADGFVVRVKQVPLSAVAVAGLPSRRHIERAISDITSMTPVIAQLDNAAHVQTCLSSTWRGERAIIHRLTGVSGTPAGASDEDVEVRLLTPTDRLDHLPAGLRYEMSHARLMVPVGTVFVGGTAASFCYPCWMTESLWDVSIDTLPEFRGLSLAGHAVRFMMAHLRTGGREPVWGALASNSASLRLAAKLGFTPAGAVVVFSRGPWAFLTAGFEEAQADV